MLNAEDFYSESFYLANNPDVAQAVDLGVISSGFEHFIESGQFQVRQPTPLYDELYYLTTNPDVAALVNVGAIASGFQHFINFGQRERRNPSILFNTDFYIDEYPFIQAAIEAGDITAIEHFVKAGQFEDFRPSVLYNPNYYLARNPDVAARVERDELTGIEHYLDIGAAQNRDFSAFLEVNGSNFPNRVASGDTRENSTILMARNTVVGPITFETATDPNFNNVVSSLTTNNSDPTVPVKVFVSDLTPGTPYFYRVTNAMGESDRGIFRTPLSLGSQGGLRFGAAGDSQGELMPHVAVINAPERGLDFFVQLGNTISASTESPDLPGVSQAETLLDFHTKHNEIYRERLTLNPWGNLRVATSMLGVWNDGEIIDNFAGGSLGADGEGDWLNNSEIFETALAGFLDYQPRRQESYGDIGDRRTANREQLSRVTTYGDDAAAFWLDVRSFRDAPLEQVAETSFPEDIDAFLRDSFDANRTMLGRTQLQQLQLNLLGAQAAGLTWKFIFSPVPMQNLGIPGASDRWEGYAAERTRLLKFIDDNNIDNVVFVSAGVGGTVVNNLTFAEEFGGPQIPVDAMEITVGPVGVQTDLGSGLVGATLGPVAVNGATEWQLTRQGRATYEGLQTRWERDRLVENLLNTRLEDMGYNPIGLEGSGIDAQEIVPGSYLAAHTFGWTEFVIDPNTQQLRVTTYGVEPYTQVDVERVPARVINRQPQVVSDFVVNPQ
ncbi:phosphodiesterase [Limnospira fusiformis CCALA 023]